MPEGPLPTFIVIGAMKSGTTSLHHYLDAHPDVCMSRPKEPNFFIADNENDLDWYRECFPEAAQAYGESSTNYTKYPAFSGVPDRMHRVLPDVKLLYLVRDPIERAVSHYVHNRIHGREERSPDDAFLPGDESHYLQTSRYHAQISRYLSHFPREQVRIIESEQLRAEPIRVMRSLFTFLGVEPRVEAETVETDHHATAKKLNPALSSFFTDTRLGTGLKAVGEMVLPDAFIEWGVGLFRSEGERPSLTDATREEVRSYLRPDVRALRKLTGTAFSTWSL